MFRLLANKIQKQMQRLPQRTQKENSCSVTLVGSLDRSIKTLSANPTKLSNTLKQFVGKFPTNCVSVFDHFVGLALKGLNLTPFKENASHTYWPVCDLTTGSE